MEGGKRKAVPFFVDMTKLADILKTLVANEAEKHEAFVTGHSSGAKGLYRYYVDSAGMLTMNVLAEITRNVSKQIDELDLGDEAFTFEVSSPGADNPLTDIRQFDKHKGRTFQVETEDGSLEGRLTDVHGNVLSFEEEVTEKVDGKKKIIIKNSEIPFEKIKKATIKISFK